MEGKIIYQKEYPKKDFLKQYEIDKNAIENDFYTELPNAKDFIRGLYADTRYIPIPKRLEESHEFIHEAIEVSKLYELDASIIEHKEKISVCLSFGFGGDMKYISRLFGMSDRISFFKDKSGSDLAVQLDLYTHVVERKGMAVAP